MEGLQSHAHCAAAVIQLRGGRDRERDEAVEEVADDFGAKLVLSLIERGDVLVELAKTAGRSLRALEELLCERLVDLGELVVGGVELRDFGGVERSGGGGMGLAGIAGDVGWKRLARRGFGLDEDLIDEIEQAFDVAEEEGGLVRGVGEELIARKTHGETGVGIAESDVGVLLEHRVGIQWRKGRRTIDVFVTVFLASRLVDPFILELKIIQYNNDWTISRRRIVFIGRICNVGCLVGTILILTVVVVVVVSFLFFLCIVRSLIGRFCSFSVQDSLRYRFQTMSFISFTSSIFISFFSTVCKHIFTILPNSFL